jgi:predicted alpha/beta superfamily hydrolase
MDTRTPIGRAAVAAYALALALSAGCVQSVDPDGGARDVASETDASDAFAFDVAVMDEGVHREDAATSDGPAAIDALALDRVTTDGDSSDPCLAAGTVDDDIAALAAIERCAQDATRSEAVVSDAIARFVTAVEGRGGFPILGGGRVRFVYVRDARWDAEDDARSSEEDFAPSRRIEPITVAGDFNGWRSDALAMRHVGRGLFVATLDVEPPSTTRWGYKFVARDAAGSLVFFSDPLSRRFQYDDNGRISFVRGGIAAGHLEWLRSVRATRLMNERIVYLYVPPGYDQRSADRYPVLYLHDGNNAFDTAQPRSAPSSWDVDASSDAEILAGRAAPFIIVALPNNDRRIDEYTHTMDVLGGARLGGRGDDYVDFIVRDVKPLIDRRYRTRPGRESTAILGSSLGGLISYHAGLTRPDVFALIGGMSSTFEWGGFGGGSDTMIARYRATRGLATREQRFYLDSGGGPASDGTCTFDGVEDPRDNYCETLEMREVLVTSGISTFPLDPNAPRLSPRDANIYHWYERNALHNEAAWKQRFYRVLRFFFAP